MHLGLFHVFDDEGRVRYVTSLASVLRSGGSCYLLCFSGRQPGDWGPAGFARTSSSSRSATAGNLTDIAADSFAISPGFGTPAAQAWLATIGRL